VNASATGSLAVEVLTADGQVQPGFSRRECRPITGDSVRHRVVWDGNDLAQARRPLRLRFFARRTQLYAFRVVGA
jgi:hypothetical protein